MKYIRLFESFYKNLEDYNYNYLFQDLIDEYGFEVTPIDHRHFSIIGGAFKFHLKTKHDKSISDMFEYVTNKKDYVDFSILGDLEDPIRQLVGRVEKLDGLISIKAYNYYDKLVIQLLITENIFNFLKN